MTTVADVDQPTGEQLIDLGTPAEQTEPKQDLRPALWIGVALVLGVVLGILAVAVGARAAAPPAAPAVPIRTVVVTDDGGSQTYQMPVGSVVSVTGKNCSITVAGHLVYAESGAVPLDSCSVTVR